jgi:class 3 adenylate cyclase/tetratricopeptide (TPR) repeat protein
MIRHVPDFILTQLGEGNIQGAFSGYILMLDIVKFTSIVEELQAKGPRGSDSIARILSYTLQTPIRAIYDNGGFVSLFSGDAVSAIFPGEAPAGIMAAISEIRAGFSRLGHFRDRNHEYHLRVQEIVSFGEILWRIYPNDYQYEYLFYGAAIQEMAGLANKYSQNAYSQSAVNKIAAEYFVTDETRQILNLGKHQQKKPLLQHREHKDKLRQLFVSKRLRNLKYANEIRNLAACFVGLQEVTDRQNAILTLEMQAERYSGFVNKIDDSDKGMLAIVLFGVPVSNGRTAQQACEFAASLREQIPTVAIGLSCGYAYAGYTGSEMAGEYTALGHTMNIASRLSHLAQKGEIICDDSSCQLLRHSYDIRKMNSSNLKGIKSVSTYYQVVDKLPQQELSFKHIFVGREKELNSIDQIYVNANRQKKNLILYITGEPGLGKSRLVWEYLSLHPDLHKFTILNCMERNRDLGGIRQMISAGMQVTDDMDSKQKIQRLRASCNALSSESSERRLLETAFGLILDLPEYNKTWQNQPQITSKQHQLSGFCAWISLLCRQKPMIIFFDDAQWMDSASISFLQAIPAHTKHPLLILATCRYLSDGNKLDLKLKNMLRTDLVLGGISKQHEKELLQHIMGLSQEDDEIIYKLLQKTGGNPLYLEQMAYSLLESGAMDLYHKLEQRISRFSTFSISDVFNSRIDGFDNLMQECLYHAAVLGMQFQVQVLSAMMECQISEMLETGIRHRLWKQISKNCFAFGHIMIHDTIYQRLPERKAHALHERAAIAIQNCCEGKPERLADEIAGHYEKANQPGKAQDFYLRSAKYNYRYGNWQATITYQRKATFLAGSFDGFGSTKHTQNLFWMALYYHKIQLYARAEEIFQVVLNHVSKKVDADSPKLSPYINNLGRLYKDTGRWQEAEALLRRSLAIEYCNSIYPEMSNVADRLNNLASLFIKQKQWKKALAYSRKALKYFTISSHGQRDFFVSLMKVNLSELYLELERFDEADHLIRDALQTYKRVIHIPQHYNTAKATMILARSLQFRGKFSLAEKEYFKARSIFYQFFKQQNPDYALVNMYLGDLYRQQGFSQKARRFWRKAEKVFVKFLPAEHPYFSQIKQRLS